ncbi:hypothetical protein [Glycomyces xiaoerkulensis]|uniref:hypothetical protein n=1 Tax=Glycomyces xiaoerkulensis TaxID=2038139 RepID=UPI000C265359|nr:hypothetical protein [Glycomyces xiaoerkulensis]
MEQLDIIVQALATGAAATAKRVGGQAISDTYQGLKALVTSKLAGRNNAIEAIEGGETEVDVLRSAIACDLEASGAASNRLIATTAEQLLAELKATGKYNVTITSSQGFVVGDHAEQDITFEQPPQA